ncbi:hypothetical protein ACHHYP_10743 [Achlya hypogyna]|uniref:Uncharacterized protein n=1 Tax=Achlya hypogyna TaxID=1202772 RepID=A0A1V9ZHS9_ACHHY|nr:hypothetical protein ACHHYP_10743 [Achlya hypogyna]
MWALDETALELVQRTWYDTPFRAGIAPIDAVFPDGLPPRSVLEIYGDAASPKTLLLLHLTAAFLVAQPDAEVYYFDHECNFDANEMRCIVGAAVPDTTAVASVLQRLRLFQATSSHAFDQHLRDLHAERIASRRKSAHVLIVVDAISSFYHSDKAYALRVGEAIAATTDLFGQLRDFARTHSAFVVVTKSSDTGKGWSHTEYMPAAWSAQVTKRLYVRTRTSPGTAYPSANQPSFQLRHFADAQAHIVPFALEGHRFVLLH